MAGGDVEKAQFVGALAVIEPGLLDRVAGIGQIDEVDALDDPPVLDVEAGDDAHLQHRTRVSGGEAQRRARVEPAVIERRPQIAPAMPSPAARRQRLDVGERGDAARGDDRQPDLPREIGGRRRVDAGQRAVAGDVGVDDRRDPGIGEAPRRARRRRRSLVSAQPSTATRPSRASMPTTMRPGNRRAARRTSSGIAQRGGAEHDPVDAETEPVIDRGAVADAAAELDVQIDRARGSRARRRH